MSKDNAIRATATTRTRPAVLRAVIGVLASMIASLTTGCANQGVVVPSLCDQVGTARGYNEASPLGWSAADVFDALDTHLGDGELVWDSDEAAEDLVLALEHRSGEDITYWVATPKVSPPPEDCRSRLSTMASMDFDTSGGTFAERVIGRLDVFEDGTIGFGPAEMLPRDIQGTAADREEIADPTETLEVDADLHLVFEATFAADATTGTVSGESVCLAGPGSGDDACDDDDYPQTFPIASWTASGVPLP